MLIYIRTYNVCVYVYVYFYLYIYIIYYIYVYVCIFLFIYIFICIYYIILYTYICQIVHHNSCFNLSVLHNSFHNQGSKVIIAIFFTFRNTVFYEIFRPITHSTFLQLELLLEPLYRTFSQLTLGILLTFVLNF